jgi:hypothetical protein
MLLLFFSERTRSWAVTSIRYWDNGGFPPNNLYRTHFKITSDTYLKLSWWEESLQSFII